MEFELRLADHLEGILFTYEGEGMFKVLGTYTSKERAKEVKENVAFIKDLHEEDFFSNIHYADKNTIIDYRFDTREDAEEFIEEIGFEGCFKIVEPVL